MHDWHDLILKSLEKRLEQKRVRLLVVDDDRMTLESVKMLAAHYPGIEVCVVDSGRAALDCLKCEPGYDMALVDLRMSPMDGIQLAGEIKRLVPTLPVVAVTGVRHLAEQAAGLNVFLVALEKPDAHAEIFQLIHALLER